MDVLSDVISTVRTGQPHSARIEWHAPYATRFPEIPGAKFLVVLQGSTWLLTHGEQRLQLGPGDVLFLPRGREHSLSSSPETEGAVDCAGALRHQSDIATAAAGEAVPTLVCSRGYARPKDVPTTFGATTIGDSGDGEPTCVTVGGSYHASASRPHPLLAELPSVVHLPAKVGRRSELPLAVGLLGRELGTNRPGGDTLIPHLLDMLVVYILRTYLEEIRESGDNPGCGFAGALRDPGVHAAVQAVHRDPAHPWSVAELGERAGLSRAAFSRRFTALVGQSPLAYVTWWRLTTAARLLREEDAPISSVATRVGYSSQFAFANAFKREFGRSPGRYREASAESDAAQSSPGQEAPVAGTTPSRR
ncbi:AraC family transcriptional regulator [Nocardiopsis sp. L17-MgMaSL7]|uniref:AraC family transcriptional regulator n=1 Tax=Nocardiopsis sp. L17-MgMaSL7 TaxID=1938893 RepID=UPI000D70EEC8|nr:AraC family transcriptional regulator [Nocardiopsis sp. L17-MgMaSL7]PWV46000.1 AraC-like DNA-binding protein [Nocardiopsis sp. L17-MgMaSL7]